MCKPIRLGKLIICHGLYKTPFKRCSKKCIESDLNVA